MKRRGYKGFYPWPHLQRELRATCSTFQSVFNPSNALKALPTQSM